MKTFTHHFTVYMPGSIRYQFGDNLVLKDGESGISFIAARPVSLSADIQQDTAGVYVSENFSAALNDSSVRSLHGQHAVIEVTMSDGSAVYMGSKDDPVLLKVSSLPGAYTLSADWIRLNPTDF